MGAWVFKGCGGYVGMGKCKFVSGNVTFYFRWRDDINANDIYPLRE